MPMGQGCMMAWERGLYCCSRNRSDICTAPVPTGATIPQPVWGTHASSKSVTQKTRTVWVHFPQSYGVKPQQWVSFPIARLYSAIVERLTHCFLMLVSMPARCLQCPRTNPSGPRDSGGEIPSSSSQGILTSKLQNFVDWRDACFGWGGYGPSPGCGKVIGCFLFGGWVYFSMWKRSSFLLLLNTSLREAEDCLSSLFCLQRPLPTPWHNNGLTLDKACVRKVCWLLANKEWEWVHLRSRATILDCYGETFPALAINQAGTEIALQNSFQKERKNEETAFHSVIWASHQKQDKLSCPQLVLHRHLKHFSLGILFLST